MAVPPRLRPLFGSPTRYVPDPGCDMSEPLRVWRSCRLLLLATGFAKPKATLSTLLASRGFEEGNWPKRPETSPYFQPLSGSSTIAAALQ